MLALGDGELHVRAEVGREDVGAVAACFVCLKGVVGWRHSSLSREGEERRGEEEGGSCLVVRRGLSGLSVDACYRWRRWWSRWCGPARASARSSDDGVIEQSAESR